MTATSDRNRRIEYIAKAFLVSVLVILGVVYFTQGKNRQPKVEILSSTSSVTATVEVSIPAGYAAETNSTRPPLLNEKLTMRVGESIRIVNADTVTHFVGPYVVASGETLFQKYVKPGEISGNCSLHPSGKVTIKVI